MSALWWLLPLALAACLAVVAVAACLSPKPRHAAPRRHLAAVPDTVVMAHPGRMGSMILAEEQRIMLPRFGASFGGSMAADGTVIDRWYQESPDAPREYEVGGPDWREQTAADLAPGALDSDVQPDPYLDAIAAEAQEEFDAMMFDADPSIAPSEWRADDSGPGGSSSVAPGPGCPRCGLAHKEPHCADGREWGLWPPGPVWLDAQLAVLYEWVRGQYAAAAA